MLPISIDVMTPFINSDPFMPHIVEQLSLKCIIGLVFMRIILAIRNGSAINTAWWENVENLHFGPSV